MRCDAYIQDKTGTEGREGVATTTTMSCSAPGNSARLSAAARAVFGATRKEAEDCFHAIKAHKKQELEAQGFPKSSTDLAANEYAIGQLPEALNAYKQTLEALNYSKSQSKSSAGITVSDTAKKAALSRAILAAHLAATRLANTSANIRGGGTAAARVESEVGSRARAEAGPTTATQPGSRVTLPLSSPPPPPAPRLSVVSTPGSKPGPKLTADQQKQKQRRPFQEFKYASVEKADSSLRHHYSGWDTSLTLPEQDAIGAYQDGQFLAMNKALWQSMGDTHQIRADLNTLRNIYYLADSPQRLWEVGLLIA